MPRHTGRTVDYVAPLKGNVHIHDDRWLSGIATVNLALYWGLGHREPRYLATSLSDAKVAARHYRQRMQPEQCFRDGKQYFALDRGTATTTARLGRTLVGLLLAGRRALWQFRRRVCSWGKLGLPRLGMERYLATPEPLPDGLACPLPESGYARGACGG